MIQLQKKKKFDLAFFLLNSSIRLFDSIVLAPNCSLYSQAILGCTDSRAANRRWASDQIIYSLSQRCHHNHYLRQIVLDEYSLPQDVAVL